jgi:hypothetical protein
VLRQAADGSGPPAGARIVALMDELGWAERAAVRTQRIAVLPDTVSFAAAAALPVAGLTALRTLRHGAPLLGKRVLITGAAGGVGHLAVQLADVEMGHGVRRTEPSRWGLHSGFGIYRRPAQDGPIILSTFSMSALGCYFSRHRPSDLHLDRSVCRVWRPSEYGRHKPPVA